MRGLARALLALLFATIAVPSFAGAPPGSGSAVAPSKPSPIDLRTRLEQEGEYFNLFQTGSATLAADGSTQTTLISTQSAVSNSNAYTFTLPIIGHTMFVDTIQIGIAGLPAGSSIVVQLVLPGDVNAKLSQFYWRGIVPNGTTINIPVSQFWRPRKMNSSTFPTLSLQSRQVIPVLTSSATVTATMTIMGYSVTDDLNFTAANTLEVLGDSLTFGETYSPAGGGVSGVKSGDLYHFKIRDYYRGLGYDLRLVAFATQGYTSSMTEADRALGRYDPISANLGLYNLSTNDVLLAATGWQATYASNLTSIMNWWTKRNPNKQLLIIGTPPLPVSTDEANAVLARNQATSTVAAFNSALVKFCDIGTAFDRTVSSNYIGANNVHWSLAGHAAVAATIQACLVADGFAPQ